MTASLTESWRIVPRARCRCLNTWLSQNWGRGGVWKEIISETKAKQFPRVMRKSKLRITSGGYRFLHSHQSNCFCDEESKGLIFLKLELTWQRQTNHALLSFWKPTWPNSCAELIYWELLSLQVKIVYLLSLQVKRLIVTSAWFTDPASR